MRSAFGSWSEHKLSGEDYVSGLRSGGRLLPPS